MARGLAGVLLIVFALAAPASAADTIIGTGTTPWGESFTLSAKAEKSGGRTMHCLTYSAGDGDSSNCPLERPALNGVETHGTVDCEQRRGVVYGAIDARVARVVVRLVGGKTVEATRFEPVAAIDPQIAYWLAGFKGTTAVRSVTAIGADGSVLARDRKPNSDSCAEERDRGGRRYPVGVVSGADGKTWRVEAFRGWIDDEDDGLVRTLCFSLRPSPVIVEDPGLSDSAACGIELTPETKALAINADDLGCGADVNLILYGVARPKVARIVLRSRAGWTVAVPKLAPRRLHAGGRLWVAGIHVPGSGFVIDAQDRDGRTIAKERLKPFKVPGVPGCPVAGGFGEL
jgi:hypothetical protein